MFKYLYAQHRVLRGGSRWPLLTYSDHIRCITAGTMREDDGSKSCLADFVRSFDAVIDSMRGGFDAQHPVPVDAGMTAIDGTHRIAAALAHKQPVTALRFSHSAPPYRHDTYASMGDEALGRAAVEYCKLRPSARLMLLFEAALDFAGLFEQAVYHTRITLPSATAQDNLITEMYLGESWLGDAANGFAGAAPKARGCFRNGPSVHVLVLDKDAEWLRTGKLAIREASKMDHDSVHTTDAHDETVRLARVLLHGPSVRFLQHRRTHMPRLEGLLCTFEPMLHGIDRDLICIDGSATLAAWGLREPADLDFVHAVSVAHGGNISSHNEYAARYPFHRDELIFDPFMHFWSRGHKFASLDAVRRIKRAIDEPKSLVDLKLMEGL